jgi:transposase
VVQYSSEHVCQNDSAVLELGDETLRTIATELVRVVRSSATIDWARKDTVRAKMAPRRSVWVGGFWLPSSIRSLAVSERDGGDLVSQLELFQAALGIAAPWQVTKATFDPDGGRLDISLDFPRGARFPCPEGDEDACAVHDTESKTWRHLDFFQHQAYLHARVPRVRCAAHGVRQVVVPWARPGSGFTLLFEALLLEFSPHMPVAAIARMVGEHDTRIWRVLEHYVEVARASLDFSGVTTIGVDETSARRGQDYVTLFMDLDATPRVLFATQGRNAATVKRFSADLVAHGGEAAQIAKVCCDMSPAFIRGITDELVNAEITFDRYHIIAQLNTAVDDVRKAERSTAPELARSKYLWLKRPERLNERQTETLAWLTRPSSRLATARAYRWRWDFDGFYDQPPELAEAYLTRWCRGAIRSRLEPIKKFVRMIRAHWDGILNWHNTRASNGILEGTNSLVQAAKRKARGYRSKQKMITIIYLIAGRLPLPTVHTI